MNTREILSIVALAALGLCLLCGLAKMAMKGPKAKQSCDHACSLLVFVAVVLVGVSQLLEEEGYKELDLPYWEPGVGALPWTFSGEGKMKKKKMSMGLGDKHPPKPAGGTCTPGPDGDPCCGTGSIGPLGRTVGCCVAADGTVTRTPCCPSHGDEQCPDGGVCTGGTYGCATGPSPPPAGPGCGGTNGCCNPQHTANAQECVKNNRDDTCPGPPGQQKCYTDGRYGCPGDPGCHGPNF